MVHTKALRAHLRVEAAHVLLQARLVILAAQLHHLRGRPVLLSAAEPQVPIPQVRSHSTYAVLPAQANLPQLVPVCIPGLRVMSSDILSPATKRTTSLGKQALCHQTATGVEDSM